MYFMTLFEFNKKFTLTSIFRCHKECLNKIPKDDKVKMFKKFYNINCKNQQDTYLQGLVEIKPVERPRSKPDTPSEKTKGTT